MEKREEIRTREGPAEAEAKQAIGRRIRAARRFLEDLADSGEFLKFGQVTVHLTEEGLWVEIRKTFK